MTTDGQRRDATPTEGRALAFTFALAIVIAVAPVVGAGVASAGAGAADGETTVEVTLPEAPDGLAGYQLTLELESGTVTGASYPEAFQPTTEPSIADDGRSVALEAADVSNAIQASDGEVVLATVSVADAERPSVTVTDAAIDADGGDRIDPDGVAVSVQGPDGTTPTDDRSDAPSTEDDASGDASAGSGGSGGEPPTEADGPGFGVLAVLGALLGIATLARRR